MLKPTVFKKGRGALQVSQTAFKGVNYIDVRNFYDSNGELKPTPKGIMIPLDIAEQVARAILEQAEDFVERETGQQSTVFYLRVSDARVSSIGTKDFKVKTSRVYESKKQAMQKCTGTDVVVAVEMPSDMALPVEDDCLYVFSKDYRYRVLKKVVDKESVFVL